MATVEVNYDNIPKGKLVEIPYLGTFENGSTSEVNDAKWQRFVRNQPNAQSLAESGRLTLTTAAAREASEARREARRAVRSSSVSDGEGGSPTGAQTGAESASSTPLEQRNKSELVEMANALNVEDVDGKSKKELIDAIKANG